MGLEILFCPQENTFQAIIITDLKNTTYTIFTYRCGSMGWARQATIGYNAAGDVYENHRLTGSLLSPANSIACDNSPSSVWSNVVYKISLDSPNITTPLPPIEPGQCLHGGHWESVCTRCCLERRRSTPSLLLRLMARSCSTRWVWSRERSTLERASLIPRPYQGGKPPPPPHDLGIEAGGEQATHVAIELHMIT